MAEDGLKFSKASNRSRVLLIVVLCLALIIALAVGLALHYTINKPKDPPAKRSMSLVDCHPDPDASEDSCTQRGCIWREQEEAGAPWCTYGSTDTGYRVTEKVINSRGERLTLQRLANRKVYGMDTYDKMILNIEQHSETGVRLKFSPEGETPYEIPEEALKITQESSYNRTNTLYTLEISDDPFSLKIIRNTNDKDKTVVFEIAPGSLMFASQYLQLTANLPSDNLYGFGEHNHRRFRHDMNWKTWPIFTRDVGYGEHSWNMYGAQPTYMNVEKDGKANMVFLKNSNAMEVSLQPKPYPAVTYRAIGGILDFYIFLGPTPGEAIQQYTKAIGRSMMPPYWSLGFHLCRWNYGTLDEVNDTVTRMKHANIPQDVQWGDIDYMYKKQIFTVDKKTFRGLSGFVKDLHDSHMKYVVIVDPGIGNNDTILEEVSMSNSPRYKAEIYENGVNHNAYVKDKDDKLLMGEVWPGRVVFPDFTNENNTLPWFKDGVKYFRNVENISVDGLWVDMNEVANFIKGQYLPDGKEGCFENELNYPPYCPNVLGRDEEGRAKKNRLYDKTICMDAKQHWGTHYDVHSLYGHSMSMIANKAMKGIIPGKRPFILTRSNFPGTQSWAFHWLGDNQSTWPNIYWSIVGILEYSIFGFPLVGSDICGFWGKAEREMCLRWHQLGAFYPFSRNHNAHNDHEGEPEFPPQDPAAWDDDFARIAREALLIRYKLLPYLYTLMHEAHVEGSTVARPLMFDFSTDPEALSVDKQFTWGSGLLISPVIDQGATTVKAYFPKSRWFDYYTGEEVSGSGWKDLDAPLDKINLHVRGGNILPWQQPERNTYMSRQNPMGLIIALDEKNLARGRLFWDDGEGLDTYTDGTYLDLEFSIEKAGELEIKVKQDGYGAASGLNFTMLEFYGLQRIPNTVSIDGVPMETTNIRSMNQIIQIVNINLPITTRHTVQWTIY